jgi:adenosylcobinamide-GDP ribazoletransferase
MLTGLASALRLLTVIPLGRWRADAFTAGAALPFFPLVGCLVGATGAGAYWLGLHGVSPLVGAALAVAAELLITGNFHCDGLADTADGLWANHGRERALEIMKDSRVGAHGLSAVACALLARFALLTSSDLEPWGMIIAAAAIARTAAVYAAVAAPYARSQGTGKSVASEARWFHLLVAVALAGAACWFAADLLGMIGLVVGAIAAIAFTWAVSRRLGGMTGDTYGAVIVITDVVALGGMLAARHLQLA